MNISFVPSTTKLGNYDLIVEGQTVIVDIEPGEVIDSLRELNNQYETIRTFDIFLRAFNKCNFELPDPTVDKGYTQELFVESEHGGNEMFNLSLGVYDRVADDGSSYLMFRLYIPAMTAGGLYQQNLCGFFIDRNNKSVGKLPGGEINPPTGELRNKILEVLIQRLGRDIKINI